MDVNEILNWIDEMVEKYQIVDEDVAALQDILSDVSDEDIYGGTEYAEDEDIPDEE